MRNVAVKVNGDTLDASEFNPSTQECMNAVTNTGQSLDTSNNFQVSTAMSIYSACGNFYTDSGSANSYILAITGSLQSPIVYRDGMLIRFIPANSNSGASNVTVGSLGSKNIVRQGGSALEAGDLTAGIYANAVYNSGLGKFILLEQNQPMVGELAFGYMTVKPGYLFLQDGYTIGNSASSATYAGAYTQSLFIYLYGVQADDRCPVSGGRTGNALNDFNAGKRMTLPMHGTLAVGAVGPASTGAYTQRYLGDWAGEQGHILTEAESAWHYHSYNDPVNNSEESAEGEGTTHSGRTSVWHGTANTSGIGGGSGHNTLQPTKWVHFFIKY